MNAILEDNEAVIVVVVVVPLNLLQVNTLYGAVLFFAGIVAVTSNCSFPYTHNGGLYYSCTQNIPDVSTDDEPFACIDDYATAIPCDVPSGTRRPNVISVKEATAQRFTLPYSFHVFWEHIG